MLSPVPIPNCTASSPEFTFTSISYSKYLTSPTSNFPDQTPATLTFSFNVANNASSVQAACSFSNGLNEQGAWQDDGTIWHPCRERTIDGLGRSVVKVETSARFERSTWVVSVNQTWVCQNQNGPDMTP
jgi:hypothetical protein